MPYEWLATMTLAGTLLLRIAGGQVGGKRAISESRTMKSALKDSAGVGVRIIMGMFT